MTFRALSILAIAFIINIDGIVAQSSSNIGDFVGQLTSLINQGGALASYVGAQGGPQRPGYGSPGPGDYPGAEGGYQGQYPGGGQGGGYGFPSAPPPGGIPSGSVPPGGIPPGGGPPPPFGGYGGGGYAPSSLYGALASIAQYDDLRCVPRLLCEVASGARPGSAHTSTTSSAGSIPFLSKDAIITLLTVLNFVDDSPLLVFGRAAVLGYTARGDPRQCLIAYPTCPRDPDKLVDYLNNHNGGFFRFFNQQIPQYAPQYQYYQNPGYPQHLGGPPGYPQPGYPQHPAYLQYPGGPQSYPQRPGVPPVYPPPQYPHPQEYYQYPQRPLPPPHRYPPQRPYKKQPYSQYNQQQGRIQNLSQGNEYEYFTSEGGTNKLIFSSNQGTSEYYQDSSAQQQQTNYDNKYNEYPNKHNDGNNKNYNSISNNNGKFAFPTDLPSSPIPSVVPLPSTASSIPSLYGQYDSTGSYSHRDVRRGKTLAFPSGEPNRQQHVKSPGSSSMVFPDRTGTGDLRLDLDEYGAYKTVHFASEAATNRPAAGSIFRGQRGIFKLRFPDGRNTYDDSIRLDPRGEDAEDNSMARSPENEPHAANTMDPPNDSDT